MTQLHIPSLSRSTSRHKRNSSSQSLNLYSSRPAPAPSHDELRAEQFPWKFQAVAFVHLISIFTINAPLPHEYVRPAIQSLLFILGSVASPLPRVGSADSSNLRISRPLSESADIEENIATLEYNAWQLILNLLSSSYSVTATHEIKQNLLAPEVLLGAEEPHGNEARKSRGAARALRLALRQGSQHRLALSRNEDFDDASSYPLISSSELGWLQRFGSSSSAGPSWDPSQSQDVLGRAVRAWLLPAISIGNPGAEAVVTECIGIANDVIDECSAADRFVSDDEARIVGEILREAVECFHIRCAISIKLQICGLISPSFDAQTSSDKRWAQNQPPFVCV